ncbi:MAG: hypothetical protein NC429_01620 [Lachnospiraceae bacterium]|nr:hypothetical protein [Lachnospiraceae bacterium]
MMEESYLEELVKNSRKQLFYDRIKTLAALVIAAGVVYCAVMVLPSVMNTVQHANQVMAQVSDTITLADSALESITTMSESITEMGDNMDTFIADNAESVEKVMKKMESVDFDSLNKAIKDLGDVVEPFANFFGKFK